MEEDVTEDFDKEKNRNTLSEEKVSNCKKGRGTSIFKDALAGTSREKVERTIDTSLPSLCPKTRRL